MEPIFNYLKADILPDNIAEARRIKTKAAKFCILYGKLYKKSFTGPYLRCVTNREAYDVLKSLHHEECRNHSGTRSLSNRAITAGYYWPTMRTDSQNYVKLCDKCQQFTTVSHLPPESTNKTIVNTLKKRLEAEKSEWVEKRPEILWSYRTTPRRSTGETPFSHVYGSKAGILIETRLATARSENSNEELDHLDERRDRAALRIQSYQQQIARHYNKKVWARVFKINNWVLRQVFQNTREEGVGKLGLTWEGPYQTTDVVGRGAYKLRGLVGRELHNSWNALHLKQYHF
ncbi:hypothetical protein LWI29_028584 [Acer saccharum]|uniref:Integrase zinc-binding domain-containing protein n=1 Tax=Acer saccharum TaxID=4024 RepID=A0AA39T3S3_ACESA|nr:hypothetical protein LWI29_028584 [Acer saccharum]